MNVFIFLVPLLLIIGKMYINVLNTNQKPIIYKTFIFDETEQPQMSFQKHQKTMMLIQKLTI